MQNTEENIAKYAVDANLYRLGYTNPKKNIQPLDAFWWGEKPPTKFINFDFSLVTEQCKKFWTKNSLWPLLR